MTSHIIWDAFEGYIWSTEYKSPMFDLIAKKFRQKDSVRYQYWTLTVGGEPHVLWRREW